MLKKYISFFLLTAFLFPVVTEQVHNFHHRNDKHCTERQTVHFHEKEHHCFVCDYIPTAASEPADQGHSPAVIYFSSRFFTSQSDFVISGSQFNYSLRGPPFIS